MRVVLFSDEDMEPITVLDIPAWAMQRLHDGEIIRFQVPVPITDMYVLDDCSVYKPLEVVQVWAERFTRHGQKHCMLFTRNETKAMALRSDILPGQRKEWQEQWRRGFSEGLLTALAAAPKT
jgi:hypothetical protein